MVDYKNKNSCSDIGKDPVQGNIADTNNDIVQLIPVSLLPEFSDDNLFEATGNELMKKTNDVPDLNNLESSATTSTRTLTLGK